MKKITKLSNLDTKGVAVVTRGANNKRIALSKGAENDVTTPIEKLFLQVIEKGDMPLDEKTIDDMCKAAGLDPQMAETVKAIMKLRYVYRDNASFQTVVEQLLAGADGQGAGDPDAPQGDGVDGAGQDEPQTEPDAGGSVAAQQQNGAPQPGAPAPGQEQPKNALPGRDAAKPGAQEGGDAKAPAFGKDKQEGGDAKAPPFGKEKQQAAPGEGDPKKEPPMTVDQKTKDEETKKAAEAVTKAAEMEAVIKSQEATIKAQTEALASNTAAVKKMQDDLRLASWVAKADKELKYITGTAEEIGKQLFDLDSVNPELAVKNFEMLKTQSAAMKANSMFRPSGANGGAPVAAGSAEEEITKRAEEVVKKGLNGKTREHALAIARVEILKADPMLYKRYLTENPAQSSISSAQ